MIRFRVFHRFVTATCVLALLQGCTCNAQRVAKGGPQMAPGYAGIAMAMTSVETSKYIRESKASQALDLLDAHLAQALSLLVAAEPYMQGEDSFLKARDRLIPRIKTQWLAHPPAVLDQYLKEYIEHVCAALKSCPSGEILQKSQGEQFDPK
jgi:hypothetical protein